MNITNIKTKKHEVEGTNIVGHASAVINGTIAVNNMAIRQNMQSGQIYLQMPQMKNAKTGNYSDVAFPVTAEARAELTDKILQMFSNTTENTTSVDNAQAPTQCSDNIDVKMYNIKQSSNSNSPVLARGSVTIDDMFAIKGIQIIANKNGEPFVAYPSRYNKDTNKSFSIIAPASKAAYEAIAEKALAAYQSNIKAAESFGYVKITGDELEKIAATDIKIECGTIQDDGSCIAKVPKDQKERLDNLLGNVANNAAKGK